MATQVDYRKSLRAGACAVAHSWHACIAPDILPVECSAAAFAAYLNHCMQMLSMAASGLVVGCPDCM
jgi:hypothetical protein